MAAGKHRHFYQKLGVWYVWGIKPSGQRWARSTKERGWRAAERRGREIVRDVARTPDLAAQESQTLNDAFIALYESQRASGCKPQSVRSAMNKGGHVLRVLGPLLDIATLRPSVEATAILRSYVATRLDEDAKRSSVAAEVSMLKQALTCAARSGLWRGITRDLKIKELAKAYTPREVWLEPDEVTRVRPHILPQWRDHFDTYTQTGVRRMELYAITAADVNLHTDEVHVHGTKTLRSDRKLPLTPHVRAILERRMAETPVGPLFNEWTRALPDLAAACAKANLDAVTVTDLRRTFASTLLSAGVSSFIVARLLGHTTTKQVDLVYGKISRSALHGAVALHPAGSTAVARPARSAALTAPTAKVPRAKTPGNAIRRNTSETHAMAAFAAFATYSTEPVAGR